MRAQIETDRTAAIDLMVEVPLEGVTSIPAVTILDMTQI
jgi:hypothetical protein